MSDPVRRREYDQLRSSRNQYERTDDPNASADFFATFASMFSGTSSTTGGTGAGDGTGQRPDAQGVFGDVFEEVSLLVHVCAT